MFFDIAEASQTTTIMMRLAFFQVAAKTRYASNVRVAEISNH